VRRGVEALQSSAPASAEDPDKALTS
jgi:hypothetical protein